MPFTAFEVNGRLFEFTRLPFGAKNLLAAFQREITAFDAGTKWIIGGKSEEGHQENLRNFVKEAEI